MLIRILLVFGLAGAVNLAAASPATACDCVGASVDMFEGADYVFVGQAMGTQRLLSRAAVSFDVTDVYRGDVAARQDVVGDLDEAACGLEGVTTGDRYVVIAYRTSRSLWSPDAVMESNVCNMHDASYAEGGLTLGAPRRPPPGSSATVDLYRTIKFAVAGVVLLGFVVVRRSRRRRGAEETL